MRPLKQWCSQQGLFSKKPYTHTFMDLGIVSVPNELTKDFFACYAWNILNNLNVSVSEMRSPVFSFFIDIDFELPFELSQEQVENLALGIHKIVLSIIEPIYKNYCIVSRADTKPITINGINGFKNGIHLNWPNILVDELKARKLRDFILQSIKLENNNLDWDNAIQDLTNWESVIDESVYINSGLRMMFSPKAEKCKACKTKGIAHFCEECNGTKFMYSRPYKPIMVIKDQERDKKREEFMCKYPTTVEEMVRILNRTSIRTNISETNLKFIEPFPSWYKQVKFVKGKITPVKKQANYLNDPTLIEETKMGCRNEDEHLDASDPRYDAVTNFVQEMWPPYPTFHITSFIRKQKKNAKFATYCLRSDQHYCHNIRREHQSNHVWFIIDPQAKCIFQRCFDPDCANYMTNSESLRLNSRLYKMLFPEKIEKIERNKQSIEPNIPETNPETNVVSNVDIINNILKNNLWN
jgi:hypothetical protein